MISTIEPVLITLDRDRYLLYTFKALRIAEQELTKHWGKKYSVLSLLQEYATDATNQSLMVNISISDICILLYAGLTHEDRSITLDKVYDFVSFENMQYVFEKVMLALNNAMIKVNKEEVEQNPQKNE